LSRATGYEKPSIHTCSMVAGMVSCAQGLGFIVGRVAGVQLLNLLDFHGQCLS